MAVGQRSYIGRFLDPLTTLFPRDVLQGVLDFRFDDDTQAWAAEMAEKANEGLLTEEEREEYSEYLDVVDFIAVMQSRARRILAQPS